MTCTKLQERCKNIPCIGIVTDQNSRLQYNWLAATSDHLLAFQHVPLLKEEARIEDIEATMQMDELEKAASLDAMQHEQQP